VKKITSFIKKIINLDKLLDKQTPLFLLLVLVLALRIPNLFEPYWYGDEGIYLVLGQTMNKGARLYSEIIDHKTPLIYYLARVHTQLNFRLLNIAWMLATTTAFFYFTKNLVKSAKVTALASLIFVLLTTLPWLEGNVPNGELFVLGFVLVGFLIISKSSYFKNFIESKPPGKTHHLSLFLGGVMIGLGILTKVPAILDLGAIFSIAYFSWINLFTFSNWKANFKNLLKLFFDVSHIFLGALLPAILSVLYFISIGSGQDYLDFGLLYNFRYAGSWGLPFESQFLIQSFTLPGKLVYLLALLAIITLLKKYIKPALQFILLWFVAALFASLLSNRPYPHYFIQIVPPLALLIAVALMYLKNIFFTKKISFNLKKIIPVALSIIVIALFVSVMTLLNFRPYETKSYYENWFKLVTGQMSKQDYRQTFDYLMTDNYKAAPIIKSTGSPDLFIWGTNPMLYALTETQPTGRFTVSFHIKDFDAFGETARDVVKKAPPFIVVMNNETHEFPELKNFLLYNYIPDNNQFDHFVLWKKINADNY
jgi:4-amino-4-deoxy-L-arabinose transferase-like glycosyltransferase